MSELNYKGYKGSFECDDDANIYHGEVSRISDVVTFQGRSIDKLKQALAASVKDYLTLCSEIGKEPEKPWEIELSRPPESPRHRQAARSRSSRETPCQRC